jgi:DTW domain-containing protein YfiP
MPMVQAHVDTREVAHAAAHFAANRERMATTRCMACWVTRAHCMCARLRRLRVSTELVDVLVAVHYKEYGKATNTAKLLPHLLGGGAAGEGAVGQTVAVAGGSSLCVYPVEPLQEQLRAAGPTLLLWPGENSVPAAEMRPWVAAQGQRVTLLVIDGSCQPWNLTLTLQSSLCNPNPNPNPHHGHRTPKATPSQAAGNKRARWRGASQATCAA